MTKISLETRNIIVRATDDMMRSVSPEPANNEELYEDMTEICSAVLVDDFLDGKYTPMEYNAIRNGIAKVLWDLFEKHIQAEDNYACSEGK